MERADAWLTEIKPITSIFKNVIINDKEPRDKPLNDIIQEEGAHQDIGSEGDAGWYKRNKGYSERIKES